MIEKVCAFILRSISNRAEILIFEHPTAGLQVPAGTVELDETPEKAVLREAHEETGLSDLVIIEKLGEDHQFIASDEAFLTQSMRCFAWPAMAAQRTGPLFTRGMRLQRFERKVGFTHIRSHDLDLTQIPPKQLSEVDGWLPSEFLTQEIRRHFYLLQSESENKPSWTHAGDQGHLFKLRWVPLQPLPELVGEQKEWWRYLGNRW